jgi:hypothetical protein
MTDSELQLRIINLRRRKKLSYEALVADVRAKLKVSMSTATVFRFLEGQGKTSPRTVETLSKWLKKVR